MPILVRWETLASDGAPLFIVAYAQLIVFFKHCEFALSIRIVCLSVFFYLTVCYIHSHTSTPTHAHPVTAIHTHIHSRNNTTNDYIPQRRRRACTWGRRVAVIQDSRRSFMGIRGEKEEGERGGGKKGER